MWCGWYVCLSQCPGDQAGRHSVGKTFCHGSVWLEWCHLMIYQLNLLPVLTLSLPIFWIVPLWLVMTVSIYFRFRHVLFRCVRIIEHVFCHAGVLVCLFVVTVADFGMMSWNIGYRILNCIMNLSFLIFGFYLSLVIPQLLFKVILLQLLFYPFIPIWNSFVS